MGLIGNFNKLHCKSDCEDLNNVNAVNVKSNRLTTFEGSWFSITALLESVNVKVDLENEAENGYSLLLCLETLDVRYVACHLNLHFVHTSKSCYRQQLLNAIFMRFLL